MSDRARNADGTWIYEAAGEPVYRFKSCPDCGVETPEAAVEAYRNVLRAISDATVPADADVHSEREIYQELARICKQLARDALAQGWTPPGTEDAK